MIFIFIYRISSLYVKTLAKKTFVFVSSVFSSSFLPTKQNIASKPWG